MSESLENTATILNVRATQRRAPLLQHKGPVGAGQAYAKPLPSHTWTYHVGAVIPMDGHTIILNSAQIVGDILRANLTDNTAAPATSMARSSPARQPTPLSRANALRLERPPYRKPS